MQLREKELELESVRCQPDHEKDQEIQKLRSALEDRERSEATRAVLCSSLAEEADQLRSQLGATVKVCQELLARLEKEKKGGGGEVEDVALQQKSKEVCDATAVVDVFRVLLGVHWTFLNAAVFLVVPVVTSLPPFSTDDRVLRHERSNLSTSGGESTAKAASGICKSSPGASVPFVLSDNMYYFPRNQSHTKKTGLKV